MPETHAQDDAIPSWIIVIVACSILVAYLSTIGLFGLSEPDEARYAEIPREMWMSGDWITPYLNYVKYFEKPPLLYWLVAATYAVFGFSEIAARAWPVLFAFLGMAVTYVVGRSMWNEWVAKVAVVLLAASPLYFGMSQILTLDMPLTGLITLSAGSFWLAYAQAQHRRRYVLLFYFALALAVLTKGPVAIVLLGGIVGAFIVLRWEWTILRWLLSPLGIVLFLLVAAPWHILVSQRNPEFFDFYVVDQHLKRYLRPDEHQQPIWYFVPLVLGGAAPWTLLCLATPRLLRTHLTALLRRRGTAATLFATLWAAVVFSFFSLSGSKLATYIIPLFPPLALLMARALQLTLRRPTRVLHGGAVGLIVIAALMLIGALVVREVVDDPNHVVIVSRLTIGGLLTLSTALVAAALARQGKQQAALAALVVAVLGVQLVAISGRVLTQCYKHLGVAIHAQAQPDDLVISYRHYTQGIPLYAQRRAVLVAARGELQFGSRIGDQSAYFWHSPEDLVAAWKGPRRMFVVGNRGEFDEIKQRLVPPPRQVAAEGKKIVIVNFPQ